MKQLIKKFLPKTKKSDSSFANYIIHDVLSDISGISAKRMFGGYGIYKNGIIFAIIVTGDKLYFKVDETNQADFARFGSQQFVYKRPNSDRSIAMPYWELPAEIMEDKAVIGEWVAKSYQASLNSNKK